MSQGRCLVQVLLITPRSRLRDILLTHLHHAALTTTVAEDGVTALQDLLQNQYDVVVIDWQLDAISGLSVLRELRLRGSDTPVLVLQTGSTVEERVLALDNGADDVLAMPCHPAELMARLRRLLRMREQAPITAQPQILCLADLTVHCEQQIVTRSGKRLMLSGKEYAILEYLIRNQGKILTAAQIEAGIAGEGGSGVISVYIHYLRRKIDHGYSLQLLHTIRKSGYVLKAEKNPRYA